MRTNVKTRKPAPHTHEGAVASRIDGEMQLRRSLMACMLWEHTFYEDGQSIADRIMAGIKAVSAEKVVAMAIEAREQMKLRHVPLLVARELARAPKPADRQLVADLLSQIIQRPDELSEFLALYWKDNDNKRTLSAQVKKGLARAFTNFSEYQLAKYNRDSDVKLRDVLFLSHAKPMTPEQEKLFRKLIGGFCDTCGKKIFVEPKGKKGKITAKEFNSYCRCVKSEAAKMAVPDTWETKLSAGADKKETFERLINEKKLGALALLRNLRNMIQAGCDEKLIRQAILGMNTDRVLPFRFISAAKYAPKFEPELEQAMFKCLDGAEKLPGKTVLLVDNSGSMYGTPVSAKSEIDRSEAACALAMLLREICESVEVIAFGTTAGVVKPRRGFALRDQIKNSGHSGGTLTLRAKLLADSLGYDRLIIVTDEQSHETITAPKGKGYVVNVASYQNGIGYGTYVHLDGWSEAICDYILAYEKAFA